jgi:uncharacterized membrane protein YfcA
MENIIRFLIFLSTAFFPSVIGAISGIGGGIIIKPVLDAVSGLNIESISFLSGSTVLAMSFVSILRSVPGKRNGEVKLEARRGTALSLGAVFGGISGKIIFSLAVSGFVSGLVGAVQSILLMILTFVELIYMRKKKNLVPKNIQNLPVCVFLGLGIGMISAFLGIGGGPINIMVISWFLAMDAKTTALHSLYTVFLSQLASFILSAVSGGIPLISGEILIAMILGGVSGGLLGFRITQKLRNNQVDALFRVVLTVVILLCAYNLIRFALV